MEGLTRSMLSVTEIGRWAVDCLIVELNGCVWRGYYERRDME